MYLSGLRGSHESRQLQWGDIEVSSDEFGEFLSFRERLTKTRTGATSTDTRAFMPKLYKNEANPSHCPIALLRKYFECRPDKMLEEGTPFYLAVNNMFVDLSNFKTWFKCAPLGKHSIQSFMKRCVNHLVYKAKKLIIQLGKRHAQNCCMLGYLPR